ncbi:hypothetical protein SAMN06265182_0984 [Persephonella hydrogeniphila]|uniref:Uncharacterized protein n=1 Tax=Persephonella hydrogeniphila TaxID=198703 RepID=A0A285NJ84_9AQUI|nr:hypothetical protein [Persephonella hydrogeniphila]SNZ07721.1 hypothetical protein SAMN06265182_0984 [Persephonella hydrogeniphila]
MAKEKRKPEMSVEEAIKAVRNYLLTGFPTGLTGGKRIEIVQSEPEGKILREFSWDIPILRKAQGEIKTAIKSLKEKNFRIYLTKNF